MSDNYTSRLRAASDKLNVSNSKIRGEGAAQYLFARSEHGAIELSESNDGVWVEFWRGDDDSPAAERIFSGYDGAVKAAQL